jgi:RNA polymerase sigma factor (sigma-70 family)
MTISSEVLTSAQQYRYELSLLPRLNQEQERELAGRARAGDAQARASVIESCLRYVAFIAARYKRYVHHDDYLDLVGVGNLAVVENVEKALTMDNPQAYLFVLARLAIVDYCVTRATLITKSRYTLAPDPSISSLDAPICQESDATMLDLIAAPEAEQKQEQEEQDYTSLYEALNILPERYREVLTRHYGLYGHPAESLYEMSRQLSAKPGPKSSAAYLIEYRALARLRSQLETTA